MKISFNERYKMLNIDFKDEPSTESSEIQSGLVAHFSSDGSLCGLEIETDIFKIPLDTFELENIPQLKNIKFIRET